MTLQNTKEGIYGAVCEYAIQCESTSSWPVPFPPCVHTSWGPGDSASRYGLIPLQKGCTLETTDGTVEIRFGLTRDLRFTTKLKAGGAGHNTGRLLDGCVMHRIVGDVATFNVRSDILPAFQLFTQFTIILGLLYA